MTARRRTIPARIQERLARTYGIEAAPAVDDFIQAVDGPAREALLIRDAEGALEVTLHLPREALAGGRSPSFDEVCQIVEGVSHFVYVAERARRELPATQLELELQAEVDKYVLLAHGDLHARRAAGRFEPDRAAEIRARLFERVTFLHPEGTEIGDRYRIANGLAARFVGRLDAALARRGRFAEMLAALRRFYAAGQAGKIELALAA